MQSVLAKTDIKRSVIVRVVPGPQYDLGSVCLNGETAICVGNIANSPGTVVNLHTNARSRFAVLQDDARYRTEYLRAVLDVVIRDS